MPSLSALYDLVNSGYYQFAANIIQYDEECSRFDSELGYTLRPGTCSFNNPEFETSVSVNSLGVRDDEASLVGPEIVVIGDSVAMGWGVEDDEVFSQVVERETGLKVLNAGVSSYGTIRELRMLNRVDLSAADILIIQYHGTDYAENLAFWSDEDAFKTMSKNDYAQRVADMPNRYLFGKGTYHLLRRLKNTLLAKQGVAPDHWGKFIYALERVPDFDLSAMHLIVLELGHFQLPAHELHGRKVELSNQPKSITVVDVTGLPLEFYPLDGHPQAIGHHSIGTALARVVASYSSNPPDVQSVRVVDAANWLY